MGFQGRIRIRKKGVDRTGAATPLAGSILFLFPCLDTITLYMYCILYTVYCIVSPYNIYLSAGRADRHL